MTCATARTDSASTTSSRCWKTRRHRSTQRFPSSGSTVPCSSWPGRTTRSGLPRTWPIGCCSGFSDAVSIIPSSTIVYENAGHAIGRPYASTRGVSARNRHLLSGTVNVAGGTPEGTAIASEDAWRRTLVFLDKYLRR
ncbi:MAG: hypothetical protein C0497_10050 [Gemmatimonas sp.]|nr:hypothetical protein [Gemmatimonas sp.]